MRRNDLNNLDALVAVTGALVLAADTDGSKGVTLANSTTYYVPVPPELAAYPLASVHLVWAAAVAATITLEVSDLPAAEAGDASETAGHWCPYNPTGSYVPVVGSGNSAADATVTAGGSAAGAAFFGVSEISARRLRIKIVVTTGGLVRIACGGKRN